MNLGETSNLDLQLLALTTAAGVCRRQERMVVGLRGDDRISFLHGMCSNDVKNLKPGSLSYALILTDRAHVIADLYIWAVPGALYLDVERCLWPATREHLEKFLVADDVEIEEQDGWTIVDLIGPRSAEILARVVPPTKGLEPWCFISDGGRFIANLPRIGLPAFTMLLPCAQVENFLSGLISGNPEIREVGAAAVEVLRVERGVARVGVDATDKTIALEARLENAISFSKGCYVGQETVERATARGGIKKRLYGLRIAGRLPQSGASAWLDGKEVGHLTSVAASPRLGFLGLAILHHSAWNPGTVLTVKDQNGESPAVVCDLPFEG